MAEFENPFTPSFGEVPLYLAGRDSFVREFTRALDRTARSPELTTLVSGARGTGKTALLAKLSEEASARGWICASVTCSDGMLDDALTQVSRAAALAAGAERKRLTGIGLGQILSLEWENDTMPSNWRSRMGDIMAALGQYGTGILITVDEVRPEVDEMVKLAATYQHFVSERRKIALLMAGLPFNIDSLREDKTVSFVRRAQMQRLERIPDYEVADAISKTVEQGGRSIEPAALERIVDASGGFPFMMQLAGYRSWNQSPDSPAITEGDALKGCEIAREELRDRILEPTYRELSDGDLAFLGAMLRDEGASEMSAIAERLGKSSAYVNTYRRRLLKQGVIGMRGRKSVGIDLPAFREFLAERVAGR